MNPSDDGWLRRVGGSCVVSCGRVESWRSHNGRTSGSRGGVGSLVEHRQSESLWQPIQISDAEPYLPDHEDFTDRIGVHYVAATIV